MRHRRTLKFDQAYADAPTEVRRAFDKQLKLLLQNWHHPSLRAHPYLQHGLGAMQARVTLQWRFYYYIENDIYVIYWLQKHPK